MSGLTRTQEIQMMEMFKQIMKKLDESHKDIVESLSKKMDENHQSLKESFQSVRESVSKKLDECHNSTIEVLDRTIAESRKFGEKLRREREQREQASQKMDDNKPETKEVPEEEHLEPNELPLDDDQMEIEEIPENKNMEPTNPEPKDSGEKKIQIIKEKKKVKMEERRTLRPRKARAVSYTHLSTIVYNPGRTCVCCDK